MSERSIRDWYMSSTDEAVRAEWLGSRDGGFMLAVRDFDAGTQDAESVARFSDTVADYAEQYDLGPDSTNQALQFVRDSLARRVASGE